MPKRESAAASRDVKGDLQAKIRSIPICLMCGKPSLRVICPLCAGRLRREALREEIGDEKHGKRPTHLSRT
jgi:hypothetical protein